MKRFDRTFRHKLNMIQADRKMLNSGGEGAVNFYKKLLKRIEKAEKENLANRKDDLLKTPTKFFL